MKLTTISVSVQVSVVLIAIILGFVATAYFKPKSVATLSLIFQPSQQLQLVMMRSLVPT